MSSWIVSVSVFCLFFLATISSLLLFSLGQIVSLATISRLLLFSPGHSVAILNEQHLQALFVYKKYWSKFRYTTLIFVFEVWRYVWPQVQWRGSAVGHIDTVSCSVDRFQLKPTASWCDTMTLLWLVNKSLFNVYIPCYFYIVRIITTSLVYLRAPTHCHCRISC